MLYVLDIHGASQYVVIGGFFMIKRSKRTILFLLFYTAVIVMMLFMFFYVQRHYGYETSHPPKSGNATPACNSLYCQKIQSSGISS